MPGLGRDHGKGLGLLAAFPRRTLEGYFLPRQWVFALICSIALLLGAFLYSAGEAQAQIQGHGPPDKAAHEGGGAPSSAQPDGRSAYQPSGGQSASQSAGHEPAQNRPVNNPNGGGNGGTHQPASQGSGYRSADHNASAPQRRTNGQPMSGQPDRAKPAHRGSAHQGSAHQGSAHQGSAHQGSAHQGSAHQGSAYQDPAYRRPPDRGSAHQPAAKQHHNHHTSRPDNSGSPGQAAPHRRAMNPPGWEKRPETDKATSPQSPTKHEDFTPPGRKKHEGFTPPGQAKHQESVGPAKPAEPPRRVKHQEAGKTTGPVEHPQAPEHPAKHEGFAPPERAKHQESREPGVMPPWQLSHQDPPKPAERTGVAGPAKQKKAGSSVITEVPEVHAGRQISTSQQASRPVGGSVIRLSRSEGNELSEHNGPIGSAVERNARRRTVTSVQRSSPERSSPSTLPRAPENETGSRLLGAAVVAIQETFAKRAGLELEGLWGAVGPALEQVGVTTRDTVESAARVFAGARPAGDLGGRGPPPAGLQGLPPISSGTGLLAGNSLSEAGSSGGGFGPLLAVLALLAVAACKGRFWDPYEIPKPGLVPRLTSERPG
jgi:hypothetical protein